MQRTIIVTSLVLLLLLTGCAAALSKKKAGYLSTVAVNTDVIYGPAATNQTASKPMVGAFGGIIGALIATAASAAEDQELTDRFKSSTHLDVVASDCVEQALHDDPYWSTRLVDDMQNADAIFDIVIIQYGFSTFGTKTSNAQPIFGLLITLTDQNGNEVWRSSRTIAKHPENQPKYKLAEYLEDMTRFDAAAAALCKDLMPQFVDSNES